MLAKIKRFTKEQEIDADGHWDVFFPEYMYAKGVHEFTPHPKFKNWYRFSPDDDEISYNYHISWLIPVEEEKHVNS